MAGLLVYIMGPSGAGKDSLIDAARPCLAAAGVAVAQRVITRSAESAGEQAMGVSAREFDRQRQAGGFAMHWQANGLHYGIPIEVDRLLASGQAVLVNGSRAHLATALSAYPRLLPILINVAPGVLRERLNKRGRESAAQIEQRLARSEHMPRLEQVAGTRIESIDNSTDLESAVQRLLELLERYGLSAAGDRT